MATAGGEREESPVKHSVVRAGPVVTRPSPHSLLSLHERLQLEEVLVGEGRVVAVGHPEALAPDLPLVAGDGLLHCRGVLVLLVTGYQTLPQHPPLAGLAHPELADRTFKLLTRELYQESASIFEIPKITLLQLTEENAVV